jgi:hypothetical protein
VRPSRGSESYLDEKRGLWNGQISLWQTAVGNRAFQYNYCRAAQNVRFQPRLLPPACSLVGTSMVADNRMAKGLLWTFCRRSRYSDLTEYSRAPSKPETTRKATESALLFVSLPLWLLWQRDQGVGSSRRVVNTKNPGAIRPHNEGNRRFILTPNALALDTSAGWLPYPLGDSDQPGSLSCSWPVRQYLGVKALTEV